MTCGCCGSIWNNFRKFPGGRSRPLRCARGADANRPGCRFWLQALGNPVLESCGWPGRVALDLMDRRFLELLWMMKHPGGARAF